jgi:uncharacterized protein
MEPGILGKVQELARKVKTVYIATSNRKGIPHLAASEGLAFVGPDRIFFSAWFCRRTVENLRENPKLSLAMLDSETQEGYQLLGETERIEEGAILDGYAPDTEKRWAGLPQAEHRLFIRVKEVLHLSSGPHSDVALDERPELGAMSPEK